jgi:hypothetical protein
VLDGVYSLNGSVSKAYARGHLGAYSVASWVIGASYGTAIALQGVSVRKVIVMTI